MSPLRLTHFYPWHQIPEEFHEAPLQTFAEQGADTLTFTDPQCLLMQSDPDYERRFSRLARACGLDITDAHGLAFTHYDLNTDDPELREHSIRAHCDTIARLAAIGVKTYTVHVGAALYVGPPKLDLPVLRRNALITLEKILPAAEKNGLVIAIENSFEATNTPNEILAYLQHFRTPLLGCCFDAGHANYMQKQGKDLSRFSAYHVEQAWRGQLQLEDNALDKLAPAIVTCHLHDNSGYHDGHALPGTGTIDWPQLMSRLKTCPRLQSLQLEVNVVKYRLTVSTMCAALDRLTGY